MVFMHDVQETIDSQGHQRGKVEKMLKTQWFLMRLPCRPPRTQ